MSADAYVDLLYLACNRLEFTQETFTTLLTTTDWRFVHELFVYDDGSRDGTREWLERHVGQAPVPSRLVHTRFGSPVAAMVHFIERASAPILAKTDNDAMLPPGWLRQSLEVLDRHPELALLGIEAMYPHRDDVELTRTYTPAEFISGLGLYRRAAFAQSRPTPYAKWFGFEEWQIGQGAGLIRGWITPALPVFLLDRFPLAPWTQYTEMYIRRGWQRSWPKYDPTSTLWQWRWPEPPEKKHPPAIPLGDPRFLGVMRIKNEARQIHAVLSQALVLCQRVFVFDDHSTDDTRAICHSFGDRVTLFPSPFEGLNEARDKNYLLPKILVAAPEWVLWIDGDEVLERSGPARLRHAAENGTGVAAYSLRIAYLWNDAQHVRVDGIYGTFKRPSFFQLKGQPVQRLRFPATGYGGNFHCGNVPEGLVGEVREINVRLKHFGYMTQEQRQAKYTWYTTIDPNSPAQDNYRHIVQTGGTRFAPGPPKIIRWVE
jgi:glycosyltransferase involved in cell wall biosynthesis